MSIPRGLARPAGLAGIACLLLLAAGGAARAPEGIWLAAPPGWVAVLLVAAVLAVAAAGWPGRGLGAAAGFAGPALLALLLGLPLAGVGALSGPPLFAVAAAAALAAIVSTRRRVPWRLTLVPACFALFVVTAGHSSVRVGPQGDEPHYLMVADSLLRDGDLSLEKDYAEGRYASFHDAPLSPHYRVRGRHHEILSLHAVGLSVLILPAWALAGYAGVTVFMALLAALLVREVHALVLDLEGRTAVALATALATALSPPVLHYAGLVFTELPAALLLLFALRRGRQVALGPGSAIAVGLASAALPWLNVRYAPLAVLAIAHTLWRQPRMRTALALLGPAVASAAGIALYHQLLYGFWDPRRVYGTRPEFAWSTLAEGLPGLFLDQEFGLLVYAPVLVLALPGFVLLLRRDRRLALIALAAVASVLAMAGSWHMWRGGFNPPGRFLVPVVPLLFVAAGLVWSRRGLSAGAALLLGWGLWIGAAGALEPQLVHRDRDDTAPLFRALSGAREWTALLPGYVLEHPDRHRLAVIWAGALLLAVPWRSRRLTAARAAAATLGLLGAAQLAAMSSRESTGDRDAVRVAGRPALLVPGWRFSASAPAEWRAADFGAGPLYEPHRHPAGIEIGRRLPVPAGNYRVFVEARQLSRDGAGFEVSWQLDRPGAPWKRLSGGGTDLSASWSGLRPTGGAVNLRLGGGSAALIEAIRLRRDRH